MSIGSLAIPMPALIFMVSVAVVFLVGRLTEKRAGSIEIDAQMILAAGLIAARIAFVIRFLPQYRHAPLAVFDIRDLGFDPLVGLIAGALVAAWRMVRNRRTRASLGLALTAGLATFATAQALTGDPHVPSTIPAVALQSLDGTPRSLDTQGLPTIVNLWATWCPPCQAELPAFAQAQADNPRVRFVFVNQGEQADTVRRYLASRSLSLRNVWLDPQSALAERIHAAGFPTTLFYDANGRLLATHLGPFSAATLRDAQERLYSSSSQHAGIWEMIRTERLAGRSSSP